MKYVLVMCLALVGCGKTSPTVSLSADPSAVEHGQCASLTWSSKDAATVSIEPGVGNVDPSGSKEVCPMTSTVYTIIAAGEGASGTASATIDVTPMTSTAMIFPEAALFDFGKSDLKPEGKQIIEGYREQAKDELTRAEHVIVTGYTDNVGSSAHNAALSLQRAEAVRDHLVSLGADPQRYEVKGAGDAMPIADNNTDEGRAKNRRVEVAVIGAEK